MTLNETLESLGLKARPAKNPSKRGIYEGERLLYTGHAHEVWKWLRETGRID